MPDRHSAAAVHASVARSRAVFATPTTTDTTRELDRDLDVQVNRVERCIDEHVHP